MEKEARSGGEAKEDEEGQREKRGLRNLLGASLTLK